MKNDSLIELTESDKRIWNEVFEPSPIGEPVRMLHPVMIDKAWNLIFENRERAELCLNLIRQRALCYARKQRGTGGVSALRDFMLIAKTNSTGVKPVRPVKV